MNFQISGPIAAVIIAAMTLVTGVWLALVFTHTISLETGLQLLSHGAAFIVGSFTPMVILQKTGNGFRISFTKSTTSDPPKAP